MNGKEAALSVVELQITVTPRDAREFYRLLQSGVVVRGEVGCSVRNFLYSRLGLTPEFVEDQVKTILLDGRPVDDLDAVRVTDGCVLALSAAMPGLVGATMRRGGFYASFRSQISHGGEKGATAAPAQGLVTVKLFNAIADSLGESLFENGVFVKKEDLENILCPPGGAEHRDIQISRDGVPMDRETFRTAVGADELVRLRLRAVQGSAPPPVAH